MAEPLYSLRFKYVRPAKTLRSIRQKLVQILLFTNSVRRSRKTKQRMKPVVLSARVPITLFKKFLLDIGWEGDADAFFMSKEEPYYQALILSALLQSSRDRHTMNEMYRLVRDLPYVDLKFWSKVFLEAFERRKWRRDLHKPARALKEVYGYA